MPESEGIPLKIINYKRAAWGFEDSFDTGIRVSEEDLREAQATIQGANYPDHLRYHYIALILIQKFGDRIRATVKEQLGLENCDPTDWIIQNDELLDAIRHVDEQ